MVAAAAIPDDEAGRLRPAAGALAGIGTAFGIAMFVFTHGEPMNGGGGTALFLLPVIYLVLVPDEIVVTAVVSGAVVAFGLAIGLSRGAVDWVWMLPAMLVWGISMQATALFRRERDDEMAIERDRAQMAEDLAISERLRLETEAIAGMGELAAGVAHEVNNPLTFLKLNLEVAIRRVLADHPDDASLAETLSDALDGADRVSVIVSDLRAIARRNDRVEVIEPRDTLETAIRMAASETRYRTELVTQFEPIPRVCASSARLGQVFLNLIVNAAQATPEGSDNRPITVSTRTAADGTAVIAFVDQGEGIAAEDLERIFEPFYTSKGDDGGTGLGLAICRRLVQEMGGTLQISSKLGEGTTAIVTLPGVELDEEITLLPTDPSRAVNAQRRVLVIDDEDQIRRALSRFLTAEGVDVVCLSSGEQAFELLSSDAQFDLILCDMMMPQMSGSELYHKVNEAHRAVASRFVFATGGAVTPEARTFCDKLSEDRRLDKPIDLRRLRSLVARSRDQ